jgi:hypothetical protein
MAKPSATLCMTLPGCARAVNAAYDTLGGYRLGVYPRLRLLPRHRHGRTRSTPLQALRKLGAVEPRAKFFSLNRGRALVVRKGNPLGIRGLADVARTGARLAHPLDPAKSRVRAPQWSTSMATRQSSVPLRGKTTSLSAAAAGRAPSSWRWTAGRPILGAPRSRSCTRGIEHGAVALSQAASARSGKRGRPGGVIERPGQTVQWVWS